MLPRLSREMAWLLVVRSGLDNCSVSFPLLERRDDRSGAAKAPTGIVAIFCLLSFPLLHAIPTRTTDIARILCTSPRLLCATPHYLSRSKCRGVSQSFTIQTHCSSQRQEYSPISGHSYCPSTRMFPKRTGTGLLKRTNRANRDVKFAPIFDGAMPNTQPL